ncbi:MAG: hypothetical protein FWC41_11770 [Firmicutes bacterium]|nr:hypothetical protein [Bacillota bacterium]
MKRKILIITATLLILAGGFSSCKKKEDLLSKNNNTDDIIGKWKLVEVVLSFTPTGPISYDYSQYNFVYDFKSDNILIVSEDIANIDIYGYVHAFGEHHYTTIKSEYGCNILKIDSNHAYWYSIFSNKLIFDNSPLDGLRYFFDKLNR